MHNPIKAKRVFGSTIVVDQDTFLEMVGKGYEGIIVTARSGVFKVTYKYLLHYKGFSVVTEVSRSLPIPDRVEVVMAQKIHSPVW